jgi:copper homeostasis protein (lipoprotein)
MAWPPNAVFEAVLEDVSRADAPAEVIAHTRMANPPNSPIRFEIFYDRGRIQSSRSYVVRARIFVADRLLFTTDTFHPVLTRGNGDTVSMTLRRVSGAEAAPAAAQIKETIEGLPATFAGNLPCADCPGIDYRLNLFPDHTFFLRTTYQGRDPSVDDVGRWLLSSDGRVLVLKGQGETPLLFSIRDADTLRLLDTKGDEILSPLNYELRRATTVEPLEPRLRLAGTYRYMADAGVVTECVTGRRLAVAQELDNAALESAYVSVRGQAGEALKVVVDGRLDTRPNPDTGADQPALVVERFISITPGDACGAPFEAAPLAMTGWRAVELGGRPVPAVDPGRAPHLVFEARGRLAGSDGCNRVAGTYQLDRDTVTFGPLAATRMACPDTADVERAFAEAVNGTRRWRILGDRLDLFDATGARVARFAR